MHPLSSSILDASPVMLSYAAALRGIVPEKLQTGFTYVQSGFVDVPLLLCLAASNPNGTFYGVLATQNDVQKANEQAKSFQVTNVTFVNDCAQLSGAVDYFYHNAESGTFSAQDKEILFSSVESCLSEGGLFCIRYQPTASVQDTLRFLVKEYASEMNDSQAKEFLLDLRRLGSLYFAQNPEASAALDKAIQAGKPADFFAFVGQDLPTSSATFDTMSRLLPRGFSFVGDAEISANYMEMVAPPSSHALLAQCAQHLLYEPIKDFVLQRPLRNDIWVRLPATQSLDAPALFNAFTFGITKLRDQISLRIQKTGGEINLTSPLFARLIDLFSSLPAGIGDFLNHPAGMGINPDEVIASIHVLVACDIVHPMRGRYDGQQKADPSKPKWANAYNSSLENSSITQESVQLASTIIGSPVILSARDALVLQAVNKVGVSLSAGVLYPALTAISENNPALAMQIMGAQTPSEEIIQKILRQTLMDNVSRWYAYGLLAA